MICAKHRIAASLLMLWLATANAAPPLQDATRTVAAGHDPAAAQPAAASGRTPLAGRAKPPSHLAGSNSGSLAAAPATAASVALADNNALVADRHDNRAAPGTAASTKRLADATGATAADTGRQSSAQDNSKPAAAPGLHTADPVPATAQPGNTGMTPAAQQADGDVWQLLAGISADVWAQIAALTTAGCAALGLLLLRRSDTPRRPVDPAAPGAKGEPKRRRVAYRL